MMSSISFPYICSTTMKHGLEKAWLVAQSYSTVLLLGESGSGKDYLARYIHDQSKRSDGPFFSINCAALPPELAESELFGHEEGAFTGARGRKRGLIELAAEGTLVLNEIGEIPLLLQAKLLTFLDTLQFVRVGGQSHVKANVRIIAATNKDLQRMVSGGNFREDLFHRLNVITIHVPALRERLEDLPALAQALLAEVMKSTGEAMTAELQQETLQAMARYSWPGNIRELRNVLERCLVLSSGLTEEMNSLLVEEIRKRSVFALETISQIRRDDGPSIITELLHQAAGKRVRNPTRDQRERLYRECMVERGWKQKDIARVLGVSEATVSNWLSDARSRCEGFLQHESYLRSDEGPSDAVKDLSPDRDAGPVERAGQSGEEGASAQYGVPNSI
jgi:transcriptional regulator with PAS, ATPase and Fis domain